MKLGKHTHTFLVTATVTTLLLSGLISCRRSKDSETSIGKLSPEEKKALLALVKAKAEYHNAVEVPRESLGRYTIEAEEALIRSDGRPVLVYATVQDIAKRDGKYFVRFGGLSRIAYQVVGEPISLPDAATLAAEDPFQEARYVLECSAGQVQGIMQRKLARAESPKDEWLFSLLLTNRNKYAVIARFSSVEKPMFSVEAQCISSEEAEIVIESPDIVVGLGHCLDLVFVGDL